MGSSRPTSEMATLPYRLLRRATGFRAGRPATRLRLLVAAEFA